MNDWTKACGVLSIIAAVIFFIAIVLARADDVYIASVSFEAFVADDTYQLLTEVFGFVSIFAGLGAVIGGAKERFGFGCALGVIVAVIGAVIVLAAEGKVDWVDENVELFVTLLLAAATIVGAAFTIVKQRYVGFILYVIMFALVAILKGHDFNGDIIGITDEFGIPLYMFDAEMFLPVAAALIVLITGVFTALYARKAGIDAKAEAEEKAAADAAAAAAAEEEAARKAAEVEEAKKEAEEAAAKKEADKKAAEEAAAQKAAEEEAKKKAAEEEAKKKAAEEEAKKKAEEEAAQKAAEEEAAQKAAEEEAARKAEESAAAGAGAAAAGSEAAPAAEQAATEEAAPAEEEAAPAEEEAPTAEQAATEEAAPAEEEAAPAEEEAAPAEEASASAAGAVAAGAVAGAAVAGASAGASGEKAEEDEVPDLTLEDLGIEPDTPETFVRRASWNKGLRCRRDYGKYNVPVAFVKGKVAVFVDDENPVTSKDEPLQKDGWTVFHFKEDEITDGQKEAELIAAAVKENLKTQKKTKKRKSKR